MNKADYQIERKGDALIFITSSFAAGKGSVLHNGIYNREFASALSAFALSGGIYVPLASSFGKTVYLFIFSVLSFAVFFVILRKFVFIDRYLEAVFDNSTKKAAIYVAGIAGKKKETILIKSIEDVLIEGHKQEVINPDGVAFVEKISAQHGMVIPGFGEEATRYLLKLKLSDGTDRTIYADKNMQDVIKAHDEIEEFLGI